MFKNLIQNIRYLILLLLLFFISLIAINAYVVSFGNEKIIDVSDLKGFEIGLVLGASVKPDTNPSDILADRLNTAYEAYESGKISKIIVSGDNKEINYNEPEAMKRYLVNLGVNSNDIFPDYAGFDTYDSIYRAKEIFQVSDLVIFTQEYHLPRALYISKKLGLNSLGIISDKQKYLGIVKFKTRELIARVKAFFDIEILKSKPKFLGDIIEIK